MFLNKYDSTGWNGTAYVKGENESPEPYALAWWVASDVDSM